jgi:hypothetical protein
MRAERTLAFVSLLGIVAGCVGDSPQTTPVPDASPSDTGGTGGLFVDPVAGDDSRPGTSATAPLKTLKRALRLAAPGTTVNLAAGIYDAGSGEDWTDGDAGQDGYTLPAGVIVTTPQKSAAKLVGVSPKLPLRAPAGGKLVNLELSGFASGIDARGGTLELVGVTFRQIPWAILAANQATVNVSSSTFVDVSGPTTVLAAQGNGIVNIFQSSFTGNKVTEVLSISGTARVSLDGSEIRNNDGSAANVQENGKLDLFGTKIQNNTSTQGQPVLYLGATSANDAPAIAVGVDTSISDNFAGIRVSASVGSPKLSLESASVVRNGSVGIALEGTAKLVARYSTVADHTEANIKATKFSNTGEPSVDFALGNTLRMTAPSGFSVVVACPSCSGTFAFGGTAWSPNPPLPTGTLTVAGSQLALAPHYRLDGNGYKVQF